MAALATTARQAVMVEYAAMGNETHCPLGMYVTPSPSDLFRAFYPFHPVAGSLIMHTQSGTASSSSIAAVSSASRSAGCD